MARNSSLVALDAATGKEIWIHENLPGLATRGIAYWESKDRKDRRLIFAINNHLQEIDARTGKSILTFGNKGLVDLERASAAIRRRLSAFSPSHLDASSRISSCWDRRPAKPTCRLPAIFAPTT